MFNNKFRSILVNSSILLAVFLLILLDHAHNIKELLGYFSVAIGVYLIFFFALRSKAAENFIERISWTKKARMVLKIIAYILFILSLYVIITGGPWLISRINEENTIFKPKWKEPEEIILKREGDYVIDDLERKWKLISVDDKGSDWESGLTGLQHTEGKFLLFTIEVENEGKRAVTFSEPTSGEVVDEEGRIYPGVPLHKEKLDTSAFGEGSEETVVFDKWDSLNMEDDDPVSKKLDPGIPKTFYYTVEVAADSNWDYLKYEACYPQYLEYDEYD